MFRKLIYPIIFISVVSLALPGMANADLIGWWKFDEGTGAIAADSSGYGHHGTINGGATWAAGKLGGALQFDGTDDYVNCDLINIDTALTGGLSVCAWINKPAGGDMKFCGNRQAAEAAGGGFTCAIYNNHLEMDFESATGRNLNRDSDGPAVPADTWVHVAWIYDDVANTFNEYHNGVLVDSSTENVSVGVSTVAFRIGANSPSLDHYVNGLIDDLRIYNHVLSEVEIQQAMLGGGPVLTIASNPSPVNTDANAPHDCVLTWTPGDFADKHNLYFGTVFEDVNAATAENHPSVQFCQVQGESMYDPGPLDFSQTCYWRVDEVNAPPTESTIYKGYIWSFTVEPFAYKLTNITATASGTATGSSPDNTINDFGLDVNDLHSMDSTRMWFTVKDPPAPVWIQYDFDRLYNLQEMLVWNYNAQFEDQLGFGFRNVTIQYYNGTSWATLGNFEFNQGTGADGYVYNTTVDFGGVLAKQVKITANSNWGGRRYGLSEVQFFRIPVIAWQPQPASEANGVPLDAVLSWRTGREAAVHQVFLSSDREAVEGGTALVGTVDRTRFALISLGFGLDLTKTYYWRVDEVNEAGVRQGDLWSFTTTDYLIVDDFEQYDDMCNRIYYAWQDGSSYSEDPACGVEAYTGNQTGSIVGNDNIPYAEQTIVRPSSSQSMPFKYNNTASPYYSEASHQWAVAQDWTKGGAKILSLWFYGATSNTAESLYVAVQDSSSNIRTANHPQLQAVQTADWQQWLIELTAFAGVDLTKVKKMYIGVGSVTASAAGGTGKLYIDDIRLYSSPPAQ
jgi:hypothetical protein